MTQNWHLYLVFKWNNFFDIRRIRKDLPAHPSEVLNTFKYILICFIDRRNHFIALLFEFTRLKCLETFKARRLPSHNEKSLEIVSEIFSSIVFWNFLKIFEITHKFSIVVLILIKHFATHHANRPNFSLLLQFLKLELFSKIISLEV